jgi:hypothetical protein
MQQNPYEPPRETEPSNTRSLHDIASGLFNALLLLVATPVLLMLAIGFILLIVGGIARLLLLFS